MFKGVNIKVILTYAYDTPMNVYGCYIKVILTYAYDTPMNVYGVVSREQFHQA